MNPDDLKPLLDGIIFITRDVGALTNLVAQFQDNPNSSQTKIIRDKVVELEVQLQLFENKLDQIRENE